MPVTRDAAVAYLGARLGGELFLGEPPTRQQAALTSAADALERYQGTLPEADWDHAVYEQALWMLGGNAELQAAGVQSINLGGISESFDVRGRPPHLAPAAWRIVKSSRQGAWLR